MFCYARVDLNDLDIGYSRNTSYWLWYLRFYYYHSEV